MALLKNCVLRFLHCRPLWRIALLISVLAIVFLATTSTPYPVPSSPNDKLNHLIAFLELTLLTRLSWPEVRALWYLPLLLAFGFAIEAIQATLPYRDFSMADLAADGAGIVIGMMPWPGLRSLRKAEI
ncbi:VanZ family protein [Marinobacter sp. F4218]|uniref:VanZ family protein n=1 Tax=Marinobacter sp. F4218 TaxID=2862868 RepID=UPI001C624E5E|nr:VanZ family protein [Marinobacter sp. F4218]MBW7471421.1 VanZ family protein [Marinobacter sp. F4218]